MVIEKSLGVFKNPSLRVAASAKRSLALPARFALWALPLRFAIAMREGSQREAAVKAAFRFAFNSCSFFVPKYIYYSLC